MKEVSEIKKYKAIDFFCGGGGMTCGLRQAGIDVIAGVDFDENAKETYEFNNPGSVFVHRDVKRLHSNYFEKNLGVQKVVGALHALIPEYAQYHWRHLHETVKNASYRDYKNQDYYRAVTETFKRYESNVQEKSEFPKDAKGNLKDGKDLMFAAFGSILSVTAKYKRPDGKDFKPDTIENVEMGQQHMSAGVMSGVRNPLAHEEIQNLKASGLFTENDCLDILSLLSHLCRRLDDAVKR